MNRSRSRTTLWNLVFHYFAVFYAVVSGIVLVPLYLKFIPLDVYGAWLATGNVVAWIAIIDPGVSSVLMQRVSAAFGRRDVDELGGLLTNGLLVSLLVAAAVFGAGMTVSRFVPSVLNLTESSTHAVIIRAFDIAIVSTALMMVAYGLAAFSQGLQSSIGVGLIFAATSVAGLVLTVVLLVRGHGLMAIPLAMLFRSVCFVMLHGAYLAWRARREGIRVRSSAHGLRELSGLMSFTFAGRTVSTIAANLEAFVVARYMGPELAPILALTRKAPDLSRMILERPAVAFMPAIANLHAAGNSDRVRDVLMRLTRLVLWLTGLAAAGFLLLNGAFVRLWVGEDLFAGSGVNLIIIIELVVLVFMGTFANLCFAMGNIKGNSIAMLVQSIVAIPLMFILVRYLGIIGVAMAPLLAMLCTTMWYVPRTFGRLIGMAAKDKHALVREASAVAISGAVTLGTLSWLDVGDWWAFGRAVAATCGIYAACLCAASRIFRVEIGVVARRFVPWRPPT